MKINSFFIIAVLAFLSLNVFAQKKMPLYDGPIPNSKPDTIQKNRKEFQK